MPPHRLASIIDDQPNGKTKTDNLPIGKLDIDRFALILMSAAIFKIGTSFWWAGDLQMSILTPIAIFGTLILGVSLLLLALVDGYVRNSDHIIMGSALLLIVVGRYIFVTQVAEGYGSDAMLFTRYAAELFLNGENPYTASMSGAYNMFISPEIAFTPTMDGGHVTNYNYPSISFLYYASSYWRRTVN